jgi:hypothetical protein
MFSSGASSGIFSAGTSTSTTGNNSDTPAHPLSMYIAREDLVAFYKEHQIEKTEAEVDDILGSRTYANQHIKMADDLKRKYGVSPPLRERTQVGEDYFHLAACADQQAISSTTVQQKEDGLLSSPTSKGYEYVHSRKEVEQGLLALGVTEHVLGSQTQPAAAPEQKGATISPAGKDFVQVSLEKEVWGCPNCGCKRFLSFDEEHATRRICAECEHQKQ